MFGTRARQLLIGAAGALAMGLFAQRGAAEEQKPPETEGATQAQKHGQEMSKGKTHEQAQQATSAGARHEADAQRATAEGKKHAQEMSKGKSHEQAVEAAKTPDEAAAAKATAQTKKHGQEMSKGKTHEQAQQGADKK